MTSLTADPILDRRSREDSRIHLIDTWLDNYVSSDPNTKLRWVSFFHYGAFLVVFGTLLFTQRFAVFLAMVLFFACVRILNRMENGCFLMKLERKYAGKSWFGIYNLIHSLFPTSIVSPMTKEWMLFYFSILNIFIIMVICIKIVYFIRSSSAIGDV